MRPGLKPVPPYKFSPFLQGILILLIMAALMSCQDALLRPLLEGSQDTAAGSSLGIYPASVTVVETGTVAFSASGGAGGYVFTVSAGTGTIDGSGVYTAPSGSTVETVRVTDADGTYTEAAVSVVPSGGSIPDYTVAASPAAVFPGAAAGGSAFTGSFSIENVSAQAGASQISWSVYVSGDGTIGAGDELVDSGTASQLAGGAVSASPVTYSGSWPTAAGTYFVLIGIAASDDANLANNTLASPGIAISGVPAPDYLITVLTPTSSTDEDSGSALSESITFRNQGPGGPTADPTWEVYLSTDLTIGPSDTMVGTNTLGGGLPANGNVTIPLNATWPATPGTYYLIGRISSLDDADNGNNTAASAAVNIAPPDIDYQPVTISAPTTAYTGSAMSEGFVLRNNGTLPGTANVTWEAYASPGNVTLGDPGDILLQSGSVGAFSGPDQAITVTGTWPAAGGDYYLVVKVTHTEDSVPANDVAASSMVTLTQPSPDYVVTGVGAPAGSVAAQPVSGSFTIQNNGTASGSAPVSWAVYASAGDALYNAGDSLIASGTTPALALGASASPSYSGLWPATPASYYVVVVVDAADAPATGSGATITPVAVTGPPPPDYAVSFSGTLPLIGQPGAAVGGPLSLTIQNVSANAGNAMVNWNLYGSQNQTLDGSDSLIASGSTPAQGAGGSASPAITANWPAGSGGYLYLIAVLSAADDGNPANNMVVSRAIAMETGGNYIEGGEINDAVGPTGSPSLPSTSATGLIVTAGNTIAIQGTMDIVTASDTFRFTTGPSVSVLKFSIRWDTGFDDIDLYIWNTTNKEEVSPETGPDQEPGADFYVVDGSYLITVTGNSTYYVSAWFYLANGTSGSTGQPYTIVVQAN